MAKKNLIPDESFAPSMADLEGELLSRIDSLRRLIKGTEKVAQKIPPSLLKDCLKVLSGRRHTLAFFEELLSRLYAAREIEKKAVELADRWASSAPRHGAIDVTADTLEDTVAFLKLYKAAIK